MAALIDINQDNFDSEVKSSDLPFLLDFSASWCNPCKQLHPILEELAGETAGKLKIGQLDVDKDGDVASNYGVMSVPTMICFVGGEVKWQLAGMQPKAKIMDQINTVL